ncbi:RagB/SusD family nutrient uptake outer membrane protein [Maribellus comscasis]|uniref:RagB/SusD family nutrient uptake outer membrane protein n=1 Tax=Maribellus comscasis TaxID=2681766 RepID=A0A6I6K0S5_9BACT|nr:RagB/SusD family nutrient uptake outer membrane protein [Maribellus comscasis]QGY45023.1 RagB/SusD family nutrient uptake outer membrane protein [Maribellus comscasis]
MKKLNHILLIFFITLTLVGCIDLEEDPKGLMAPEGFFETASDVEAAVYGAYAEWVTVQVEKYYFLGLMLRSDMVDIGDRNTDGNRIALNEFSMDAKNSLVAASWERLYQSISAANTAIQGARSIEDEAAVKNELEAKARFIRAFTYFHLVRAFGDVPYLDSPIESAEAFDAVERTPSDEIYQYIIDDLLFAKEYLPVKNSPDVRNIGTKGSAATALAEVYLTLERYSEAATEARYVIDNAAVFDYNLATNYQDLFNAEVIASLKEPIFTYELKNTLNDGNYNQADGMINLTRIRDLAPRSLSVAVPSLKVYQSWDDRDYRKKVCFEDTVVYNGVVTALVDAAVRVPRPHIAKYFRYPGPQEAGDDRSSDHHYCMYRYADVLLFAAEAIAESEGATPEAIGYINQIRARARYNGSTTTDFPADVPTTAISTDDFIQLVREERRLEFAFEFKRWYDIKRWGIINEAFLSTESMEPHNVDLNRDYLFPIPQTEIDVTDFIQNPGY